MAGALFDAQVDLNPHQIDATMFATAIFSGTVIGIVSVKEADYICLTDIARYRDAERTDYLIQNWLRTPASRKKSRLPWPVSGAKRLKRALG